MKLRTTKFEVRKSQEKKTYQAQPDTDRIKKSFIVKNQGLKTVAGKDGGKERREGSDRPDRLDKQKRLFILKSRQNKSVQNKYQDGLSRQNDGELASPHYDRKKQPEGSQGQLGVHKIGNTISLNNSHGAFAESSKLSAAREGSHLREANRTGSTAAAAASTNPTGIAAKQTIGKLKEIGKRGKEAAAKSQQTVQQGFDNSAKNPDEAAADTLKRGASKGASSLLSKGGMLLAGVISPVACVVAILVAIVAVLLGGIFIVFSSSGSAAGSFSGVPHYLQYDEQWGGVSYGDGTIANSGCSPTSVAMVASYFNQVEETPDKVVSWAGNRHYVYGIGTATTIYPAAASEYDLICTSLGDDIEKVVERLLQGEIVIASMGPGAFTTTGHLIVLTGIDIDGNILVNDPNDNNVKQHYLRSFTPQMIAREGKYYYSFWKEGFVRPVVDYSDEDVEIMARVIECEAGSSWCTNKHQQLVASVVLNRVSNPHYPSTIEGVIRQPGQYACVTSGRLDSCTPSSRAYSNAQYVLANGSVAPSNVIFQANFRQGSGVYAIFENPNTINATYKYTYFCY